MECIYLVDDLPSELDEQHRLALCQLLDKFRMSGFYHLRRQTLNEFRLANGYTSLFVPRGTRSNYTIGVTA